jgi:hypothetical protein
MATEVDQSAIVYNTGKAYYGDDQMYKSQIASFEVLSLDPLVENIHMAWKNKDYNELCRHATKLKNAAGSVAAIRLQTATESLIEVSQDKNENDIATNYGTFLFEARCLKVNIGKYTESPPHLETIDLFSTLV